MNTMTSRTRILAALDGQPTDRPPVWIMRQAGRTLPEYRSLRSEHDFLTVLRNPELAAEVTLQPLRRFGYDAAILFSDILTIPSAMGQDLSFAKGMGPKLKPVITCQADVDSLIPFCAEEQLSYVAQTLDNLRVELGDDKALLGFAGAPFTLASYMIEGGSTRTFHKIKGLMARDPALLVGLMDVLADAVAEQPWPATDRSWRMAPCDRSSWSTVVKALSAQGLIVAKRA